MTAPIKILSKSTETFEGRLWALAEGQRAGSKPESLGWVHLPPKVIDELTSWARVSGDGYIGTGEPHRIMR